MDDVNGVIRGIDRSKGLRQRRTALLTAEPKHHRGYRRIYDAPFAAVKMPFPFLVAFDSFDDQGRVEHDQFPLPRIKAEALNRRVEQTDAGDESHRHPALVRASQD